MSKEQGNDSAFEVAIGIYENTHVLVSVKAVADLLAKAKATDPTTAFWHDGGAEVVIEATRRREKRLEATTACHGAD